NGNEKKIPKEECTFEIETGNEKTMMEGKKLIGRPADRIKLNWRKNP
ncbi:MAG: ribonuclease P protein subunit, partial [Candidatus Diapherotrites archaeon]|nr:ribonuclease P protein subunit [Candidatus Diapherotrites archaeon]